MARYEAVARSLALLSDGELIGCLDGARPLGSGIGGTSAVLQVEGTRVFVKRVPLTDLERRPENVLSTANVFGLPTFYQYGVGSTGFGVWRELAAHAMTTDWVIGGQCESFPLMYHWRVLEGPRLSPAPAADQADLDETVAYWDGSAAVRARLEAIAASSASVVLFVEYVPHNLRDWLAARGAESEPAIAMVERDLRSGVAFMSARGLLHFDAHFRNILTDGRRLYFGDFGLATASSFDLSESETRFFAANATHDACYTARELVNWLVTALAGPEDRDGFIRCCAEGGAPLLDISPAARGIIMRDAPIAVVMNEFYRKLHFESRQTPYPMDEIQRLRASRRRS